MTQELEEEFKNLVDTVGKEIEDKLKQASKTLQEACELSDKYGIPFSSPVSGIYQNYVPSTLNEKFGELGNEKLAELSGLFKYDLEDCGYGWQHSEICY